MLLECFGKIPTISKMGNPCNRINVEDVVYCEGKSGFEHAGNYGKGISLGGGSTVLWGIEEVKGSVHRVP